MCSSCQIVIAEGENGEPSGPSKEEGPRNMIYRAIGRASPGRIASNKIERRFVIFLEERTSVHEPGV